MTPRRYISRMENSDITFRIRSAIFAVFKELGRGLLENIYIAALAVELRNAGLSVKREHAIEVIYKSDDLGIGYRLDLLVEDEVIVEVKSVEKLHNVHKKQLLTYLKLTHKKVGILVNFNEVYLQDKVSLIRVVN
jgi:GxxExxY protein